MTGTSTIAQTASRPLSIDRPEDLVFGRAPRPVPCGLGLTVGDGRVYPELNFTLPVMTIDETTWPEVLRHYEQIGQAIVRRASALKVPGLVAEFEQLPAMTDRPQWGAEITAVLKKHLTALHDKTGIPVALRVTVVDLRDAERPPRLRHGRPWEKTREAFVCAAQAGADILSIESIGGKEVHDEALMYGDLAGAIFALGCLGCRDMAWLWTEITAIARAHGIVSGGDTACGFSNTAMQLAGKGMLPDVLAALDRAASAPRSLAAYENGAVGPSKDCAYEGPVVKAVAGCPISMEGKSSSCAHFSPLGNIAGAAADLWSNESVQNIQLLSGPAPEAFLELLAYDCRLFNTAAEHGQALQLRDWLVAGDVGANPQALMLEPQTVIRLARAITGTAGGYERTLAAVRVAFEAIRQAAADGRLSLTPRESTWLQRFDGVLSACPETEQEALARARETYGHLFLPEAYGLPA